MHFTPPRDATLHHLYSVIYLLIPHMMFLIVELTHPFCKKKQKKNKNTTWLSCLSRVTHRIRMYDECGDCVQTCVGGRWSAVINTRWDEGHGRHAIRYHSLREWEELLCRKTYLFSFVLSYIDIVFRRILCSGIITKALMCEQPCSEVEKWF